MTDISDEADYDDPDDDRYDEYKDGVAMGYINPDGSQREPDEPDWEAEDYAQHCHEVHGGAACDCPPSPPIEPAGPDDPDYADEAPF